MTTPSDPLPQLLKHYLFGVARKFIHLARPGEQHQLIDLIRQVNADIESLASKARPIPEREEQPVLTESAELISGDDHWLVVYVRRQTQRQETYIRHLEKAIRTTETHARDTDSRFYAEPARSAMLERTDRILGLYQQQLTTARINQEMLHHQLGRLTIRFCSGTK